MLEELIGQATRGTAVAGLCIGALWKGDDFLSEPGRRQLFATLVAGTRTPGIAHALMARWFGDGVSAGRFLRHVLLFSLASLGVLLSLYLSLVPGLWSALAQSDVARAPFLGQVLTGGLPIVLLVNYFGFMAHAIAARRPGAAATPAARLLARDIALRVALFVGLTALYFAAAAVLGGAFLGSPGVALGSLGPTLLLAATFGNLTGVYLYAAALAAFPLFVASVIEWMQRSPAASRAIRGAFFFLPFENRPIRSVGVVLGVFLALVAVAMSFLAALLPGR